MTAPAALVEKFVSIQGEGRNAGRLAFFLRFAGCNLDCRFADGAVCDTPWQKAKEKITLGDLRRWLIDTHFHTTGRTVEEMQLIRRADRRPMVVITGGEPTMAPLFDLVVDMCLDLGFYVAVESNGTIWRESLSDVDWLVVSPKADIGQGNPKASAEVDPRVAELPPHEYRIVVSGPEAPQPNKVLARRSEVYVSPALEADGTGLEAQRGITPRFVPGAVERALQIIRTDSRIKLSLQTHKWIQQR